MELPILAESNPESPDALVRAIKRATADLAETHSVRTDLEAATAFHDTDHPHIHDANFVCEIYLSKGVGTEKVYEEVAAHFQQCETTCYRWSPAGPVFPDDLLVLLEKDGYTSESMLVLDMKSAVKPAGIRDDLQIVPAQAVIEEYRSFRYETACRHYDEKIAAHLADCHVSHLDSTRLEMLVARLDRQPVAVAGVMTIGEIGILWDVATHPDHHRQGIQKTLMAHLLDLCARSQFKKVTVECRPDNAAALSLYQGMGMSVVAETVSYCKL